jgi:hypothetical protein
MSVAPVRDEPAPRPNTASTINASGAARGVSLRSGGEEREDGEGQGFDHFEAPIIPGAELAGGAYFGWRRSAGESNASTC